MKRILWAGAFAFVAGGQALAADLPPPVAPRAPATYVPTTVPVYNWSGIYIGANGGYGFGTSNWSDPTFGSTGNFNTNGWLAGPGWASYCTSKAGLIMLTKCLANDYGPRGLRANCVCPGWVRTELVKSQLDTRALSQRITADEAARSLLRSKQPMHQFSTVESVGALAVFLCSDLARTMTGTAISMDGGWAAI